MNGAATQSLIDARGSAHVDGEQLYRRIWAYRWLGIKMIITDASRTIEHSLS